MSETSKKEIASDTVKQFLDKQAFNVANAAEIITHLTEENQVLQRKLDEANSVIEADIKAGLKRDIMAASAYSEADLEDKNPEQLIAIASTLSKSKGFDSMGVYKSIRAGSASADSTRLTVGSPFGLTEPERARWLRGEL